MTEQIEDMEPSDKVKITVLKEKIEFAKSNRFSAVVSGQAANEIGNEKEAKRMQDLIIQSTKEIIFYRTKLAEIEKS